MVLKRIGMILEGIAVLIFVAKYFFFWSVEDFCIAETTKFITEFVIFGGN